MAATMMKCSNSIFKGAGPVSRRQLQPASCRPAPICKASTKESLGQLAATLAATSLLAGAPLTPPVNALSYDEIQGLTYTQVKGSGIAASCPTVEVDGDLHGMKPGKYKLQNFCMEPTSFKVKEEKGGKEEFVDTTLLTRLTYSLVGMEGEAQIKDDGSIHVHENEGLDYAATTVRTRGDKEYTTFLFSIKDFDGNGNADAFSGDFLVPSYRGATYMDPRGRGAATGYDHALQIPAGGAMDDERREKYNNKIIQPGTGSAIFSVAKADPETGEMAGVFETIQPSNTEMGAHEPKDILTTGLWYGQLVN